MVHVCVERIIVPPMAEELSCLIVAVKGSLISLLRLLYLLNQPDSRPGHTHKSSHLTETRLD